jgi:hypothetical protein
VIRVPGYRFRDPGSISGANSHGVFLYWLTAIKSQYYCTAFAIQWMRTETMSGSMTVVHSVSKCYIYIYIYIMKCYLYNSNKLNTNIYITRGTLYPQKLTITSPTSGGRSVGIVRSRTQTMEFSF